MSRKPLSVALLQEKDRGSVAANLDAIEAGLREAKANGVQLVLLQELHNGAYFCQHESVDEFDRAEPIPGPSTERLGQLFFIPSGRRPHKQQRLRLETALKEMKKSVKRKERGGMNQLKVMAERVVGSTGGNPPATFFR